MFSFSIAVIVANLATIVIRSRRAWDFKALLVVMRIVTLRDPRLCCCRHQCHLRHDRHRHRHIPCTSTFCLCEHKLSKIFVISVLTNVDLLRADVGVSCKPVGRRQRTREGALHGRARCRPREPCRYTLTILHYTIL